MREQFLRLGTAHAEPGFVSVTAAVGPAASKTEIVGHLSQIPEWVFRIIYAGFSNGIVGPR